MLQFSHKYHDIAGLKTFVAQNELKDKTGLIQLYSGCDQKLIESLPAVILEELPGFKVIGTSTSGEIIDGQTQSQSVIIDCLVAESATQVDVIYLESYLEQDVLYLKDRLNQKSPKLAIIFSNALRVSPEPFVRELKNSFPDLLIAGGNAADNDLFSNTFVISGTNFYPTGSVCAFFSGESLSVKQRVLLGWESIGQTFEVTKAEGNRLYSLDGSPIMSIYKKYIGPNIEINFPNSTMEFPLLIKRGKERLLRAPVGVCKDNGVIFAGDFKLGDSVTFSFADPTQLFKNSPTFDKTEAQAMLVFACAARKSYLGPLVNDEVGRISGRANNSGAFLYGEFSSLAEAGQIHNLSQTIVFLSESSEVVIKETLSDDIKESSSLMSLAHLARKTGTELASSLNFLKQHQFALNYSAIVSMTDADGVITYVNQKFEDISGYRKEELIGRTHQLIRHQKMPDKLFSKLWSTIKNQQPWQGLIRNQRKDGSSYFVKTIIVPILDDTGQVEKYLSIRTDVTDIVNAKKTIQKQQRNPLTDIPNRIALLRDIHRASIECVALFDAKGFKVLNDHWGFDYGDSLIRAIGMQLISLANKYACRVYHVNGALFAIAPKWPTSPSEFERAVMKTKNAIEQKDILTADYHHEVNFSVGIGRSSKRPVIYAESALLEAKSEYLPLSVVMREESNVQHDHYFWLEESKLAIDEGRIVAVFQEILALNKQNPRRRKYETLARLLTKNGALVSPSEFLAPLKTTRYYRTFTRIIVDAAIKQSITFNADISVNVSVRDLHDNETIEHIATALSKNPSASITFEITESEAIKDFSAVDFFIRKVRGLGAKIAIDDFGSGYSNFSYLIEIKPDFLKIDGSIISMITSNENSQHVTRGIVEMARAMGISTVAEFVSNQMILNAVEQCGINYAQGFYIGKPELAVKISDYCN
ncbi:MAG: EAL domain-containing protein [Idiomarina sp.]|nr:EAL domain-containing protein [Idiomarina sp.]